MPLTALSAILRSDIKQHPLIERCADINYAKGGKKEMAEKRIKMPLRQARLYVCKERHMSKRGPMPARR